MGLTYNIDTLIDNLKNLRHNLCMAQPTDTEATLDGIIELAEINKDLACEIKELQEKLEANQ